MIYLKGEIMVKNIRFLHNIKSCFIIEESGRNHFTCIKLSYYGWTKNCCHWIICKAKNMFILGTYPINDLNQN